MANNVALKSDASTTVATAATFDANGVHAPAVSLGGNATSAVAAGTATDTVVKNNKGILCRVLVTTAGSNPMEVYDHATTGSGTKIGIVPANSPAGSVLDFHMPALNGITIKGHASNPAVTVAYV